ncbi:MAG: hypothetical protein Q7T76_05440, partial [Ferruginibacter sp.]|nr:hypothetical protein [Ferruginibacter sp.]
MQFTCWAIIFLADPNQLITNKVTIPLLLINLFAVIFMLVAFRLLVKEVYFMAQAKPNASDSTLIFGEGMMGQ